MGYGANPAMGDDRVYQGSRAGRVIMAAGEFQAVMALRVWMDPQESREKMDCLEHQVAVWEYFSLGKMH